MGNIAKFAETLNNFSTPMGIALSGIQIAGGLLGANIAGNEGSKWLDPESGAIPKVFSPEKYKFSGGTQRMVDALENASSFGFDAGIKKSFQNAIEHEKRTNTFLAKETSGGSGANAFNRAIAGNISADSKMLDFAKEDQLLKEGKMQAALSGAMNLEGMKLSASNAYNSQKINENQMQFNEFMLKNKMAQDKVDSMSGLAQSGFKNFFDLIGT